MLLCSGTFFGGHVRFVFTIVLFIFVLCVVTTITSFNEIPLDIITNPFKVFDNQTNLSSYWSCHLDSIEEMQCNVVTW